MNLTAQIAKHFKEVHFGGNWTSVDLKETLADIDWQQATTKVYSFNTIAALVYHINYYVSVVTKALKKEPLNAHDKYSFDLSPIQNQEDWEKLLNKTWTDAENFTILIEQLPEGKLGETFFDQKNTLTGTKKCMNPAKRFFFSILLLIPFFSFSQKQSLKQIELDLLQAS